MEFITGVLLSVFLSIFRTVSFNESLFGFVKNYILKARYIGSCYLLETLVTLSF